ncbi:RNA polymerase subunit sigma [Chlorella sorokiniana]|uniref:RNA polymerase subunit sigma n=1 Tax=Chlorella sorokiniana TaxID=3076 RepID=A0A2P6TBI3_CHLSO|nr:RNA polymerase subunit sigma [Chlorella sorokiniana]|eukprot:PRW05910.1 RNA polymerase subunit sigma [Chlorella sorokiniana]
MRRGALRACVLLLRRSAGTVGGASEPTALLTAGPHAAAVGGQDVRQQFWAPWLQAPLHSAAPTWLQAAAGDSSDSDSDPGIELVKRTSGHRNSPPLPVRPELAAELRPLVALAGVADAAALSRRVAALGPKREQGVLQHGAAVAQWLLSLGVPRQQLAELLHCCPYVFSWPADERAAVLFGQLAWLGLTAAEAARCFEQQPTPAGSPSFEPAIAVLAALFAAGSGTGGSKSGEQLLGDLLRKQPAAVGLLKLQPSLLQERISSLVQRYGPHWKQQNKQAVIVTALRQHWELLNCTPAHLRALEAMLQQEVGQQPGDGTRLLATIVQRQTRAASCSPETLRQRLLALLVDFGRERLLQAGPTSVAELLAVDTANWQRALAVWRLLGVADPAALGLRNTRSLALDWLAAGRLASLAALQRLLPAQPSFEDTVQKFSGYIAAYSCRRLIGRLLFLQQEGALPLLVADKRAALQQWRRQHGLPASEPAAGEPSSFSISEMLSNSDADLCALPALRSGHFEWHGGQAGSSGSSDSSSTAERYHAFMAQLPQLPAYQRLLAAGEAESRRLAALLPPELAAAAGEEEEEEEEEEEGKP